MQDPVTQGISWNVLILLWNLAGGSMAILWPHFGAIGSKQKQISPPLLCVMLRLNLYVILNLLPMMTRLLLCEHHGPLTRNVKLRVAHVSRMPRTFPPLPHQRKPQVSDLGMHHGTCVTHVPWCMSGSLTHGGGENVPRIPRACATRNLTFLAKGLMPIIQYCATLSHVAPLPRNGVYGTWNSSRGRGWPGSRHNRTEGSTSTVVAWSTASLTSLGKHEMNTCCEINLRRMLQKRLLNKHLNISLHCSRYGLVSLGNSHYLSQVRPRFMSPCGVTRPHWVWLYCHLA